MKDLSPETRDSEGYTALHRAAGSGDREMVMLLLLKQGVDIEARDWRGRTPLFIAASEGHRETVELLISKGADVNAGTIKGFMKRFIGTNPLKAAQGKKQREIADIFGPDPEISVADVEPPAFSAAPPIDRNFKRWQQGPIETGIDIR